MPSLNSDAICTHYSPSQLYYSTHMSASVYQVRCVAVHATMQMGFSLNVLQSTVEHHVILYLQTAEPGSIYGQLWQHKLQPFPDHLMSSYKLGISATLADSHFAFMALEDACQDTLQHNFSCTEASQILALPQTYFRGGLSFALQRNSQYKEVIDHR